MKKLRFLFLLFPAGLFFILGIYLQREHAFTSLRRILQGRPPHVAPPQTSILDINLKRRNDLKPLFDLEGLPLEELQRNQSIYQKKLKELLRLSEFPSTGPAPLKKSGSIDLGKVFREEWSIETEPGVWIPFYLFIPKTPGPHPLILVLHGHSSGKSETAGLVPSYQKGNALALAEAGFVTAAPDFRGFGKLGWDKDWNDPEGHEYGRTIHIQDVLYNLNAGRTVLGSFIYDLRRILDILVTRPEIDKERIGVTGTSMGGDVTIWLGILDPRIGAVFASAASMMVQLPSQPDYGSYHPCIDTIPDLLRYFRPQAIPLLLAPRPVMFDLDRHRIGPPPIRPGMEALYAQAQNPEKLAFHFHSDGEDYHNEAAVEWFRKWLAPIP